MNIKYITPADETVQLKYLLAKDDVDDIDFACTIIAKRLQNDNPGINVSVIRNRITLLRKESSKENIFKIELKGEILYLEYLYSAPLHLFRKVYEIDTELLDIILKTLHLLEFKKLKESTIKSKELITKKISFQLEVTRRRRY